MIRRFSFLFLVPFLILAGASSGLAAKSPTDTIQQTVNDVLNIVKNPDISDPAKKTPLLKEVEDHIRTIFDFSEFSSRTVGPKWRTFTPDQKQKFEDAFADLLRATYVGKLESYCGEKVNFTGEVMSSKGDKAEVQSSIQIKDKIIPVAYRLLVKNNEWKVYDVRIENVSLIESYRGQFKDILLRGSAEDLIQKVLEKAQEIKQQNNTAKS